METAGSIYGEVLRELKKVGLRLDDAHSAADVADRVLRGKRDELLIIGRKLGIPTRKLGNIFGLNHSQVSRIASFKSGAYLKCKRTRPWAYPKIAVLEISLNCEKLIKET